MDVDAEDPVDEPVQKKPRIKFINKGGN